MEIYQKFVQSSDERYAHVTDDERSTVRGALSDTETWLYEMIEKQVRNTLPMRPSPDFPASCLGEFRF